MPEILIQAIHQKRVQADQRRLEQVAQVPPNVDAQAKQKVNAGETVANGRLVLVADANNPKDVMGWSFRKSFKAGPIRLNLSKSGISTSFGVKGARINISKRGTFINLGAKGTFFRKRLGGVSLEKNSPNMSLLVWVGIVPSIIAVLWLLSFLFEPLSSAPVLSNILTITRTAVHVRESPSIEGKILKTTSLGDTFPLTEVDVNSEWVRVSLSALKTGYVKRQLGVVSAKEVGVKTVRRFDDAPYARVWVTLGSAIALISYCIWLFLISRKGKTPKNAS
jgi:hypothetical protein